jgi:putative serine protease PepD
MPPAPAVQRQARATQAVALCAAAMLGAGVAGAVGLDRGRSAGSTVRLSDAGSLLAPAARLTASAHGTVPQGPCSAAPVAAKVIPSVVTITTLGTSEEGTGAGVILSRSGYILTNNHVVSEVPDAAVTVTLSNGRTGIPARVIGRSPLDDLAVVKISAAGLTPATLGDSDALAIGDPVIAVGSPLGFTGTVTSGIVSGLHRNIDVPGATSESPGVVLTNAIQTDAAINPGNSGGALADCSGDVVGINSAIATTGQDATGQSGSIGVGFAIPIDYAGSIAAQLISTGHARLSFLGVLPENPDPHFDIAHRLPPGAYLVKVAAGSPAARAGLKEGDVIVKLGTFLLTDAADLYGATRSYPPGARVPVVYFRDGRYATVTVTLGLNPNG